MTRAEAIAVIGRILDAHAAGGGWMEGDEVEALALARDALRLDETLERIARPAHRQAAGKSTTQPQETP